MAQKKTESGQSDLFGDVTASAISATPKKKSRKQAPLQPAERFSHLAEVAVDAPVYGTFTYIADDFIDTLTPGTRVLVPFGRRPLAGFFLGEKPIATLAAEGIDARKLKKIIRALDEGPAALTPALFDLAHWMARHYVCPLGQVLSAMLPAGVKRRMSPARRRYVEPLQSVEKLLGTARQIEAKKPKHAALLYALALYFGSTEGSVLQHAPLSASQVLADSGCGESALKSLASAGLLSIVMDRRELRMQPAARSLPPVLNAEQRAAVDSIGTAFAGGEFKGFLLHGVTGSGKTEVYLHVLEQVLAAGRQAIVLVPEIALTPQTAERFEQRLGSERVAVLHSHVTDGDRAEAWRDVRAGKIDVVVGARSALFAPLPRLGAIVIDEEHEGAFKQESAPRYHARDTALELARITRSVLILGSATPSFESLQAARQGELQTLVLSERAAGNKLPDVRIVDIEQEGRDEGRYLYLSGILVAELRRTLAREEQAILFINRRGFATVITCRHCGHTETCEHCDISLTSHRQSNTLVCHYCNFTKAIPDVCSACFMPGVKHWGQGTERVEAEVRAAFPSARIARMDSDTMNRRSAYMDTLGAFRARQTDILIGTQMIAKGLDFPLVTLVGVVQADTSLHMPDFRSRERTCQLLAQVSGRAGRSERGGRVIIQTRRPNDAAIRAAATLDFEAFQLDELRERKQFDYPPWRRLARIILKGPDEKGVQQAGMALKLALDTALQTIGSAFVKILGPTPAPIARIEDQFRYHVLIKAESAEILSKLLSGHVAEFMTKLPGVASVIDVDPVSML